MGPVAQSEFLCPSCGGQCVYAPRHKALTCQSCGASHEIKVDPDADPARELHYHPDQAHTEQPQITADQAHQCQTCGGEVIFAGPALTGTCPYCEGPLVLTGPEESYQTLGLIPFEVPDEDAQNRAVDWVRRRWAAPNALTGEVAKARVAGIYVPSWTFDSAEAVNYLVKYRVKQGKNWVTRTFRSSMKTAFDDLLVPASPHVTPLIRDGILHDFDPHSLKPYEPAFLAGFPAERHHQSVTAGLEANAADKDLLLRNRIRRHSGKSRITSVTYKTDTTGIRYRRILLPVWILHYAWGEETKKVVVCGLRGRTFGERPFSLWKLFGLSSVLSAAVILVGWLWGVAGFL